MKNKKWIKIIISFLLIIFIICNFFFALWPVRGKYLSTSFWSDYQTYKHAYINSQYVSKHPTGWIPDEIVNAYAGGAYIKGVSPILIAPDTPPLGRYLIGLSGLLFNNPNTIILLSGIVSLVLLYLIGMQVFRNSVLALIAPAMLSFEPLFQNQFVYTPNLDIIQMAFLLGTFYVFNKGLKSKRYVWYFLLANTLLGCFIATKFFITGLVMIAAWYAVLFLRRDKQRLIGLSIVVPVSVLVLLLSYVRVLFDGYTLPHFLGIQKWVYLYHKSQLILPLSIWPLLLMNKWFVWWGDKPILSDAQWRITWPLMTIISLYTIVMYLLHKMEKQEELEVIMAWAVFYLLFFSIGQISARYFVILFPVLYLIAVYGIWQSVHAFQKRPSLKTKR